MRAIPHPILLVCAPMGVQTNILRAKTGIHLAIGRIFVNYRGAIEQNRLLKEAGTPTHLFVADPLVRPRNHAHSMTFHERQQQLESLAEGLTQALWKFESFRDWQAAVLPLLDFDKSLEADMRTVSKEIIKANMFGPGGGGPAIRLTVERVLDRARTDLRLRAADEATSPQMATATIPTQKQSPKKLPKIATTESGLIWIWYHSDAPTLTKLGGVILGTFGLGFVAGKTGFFVELWGLIKKTFA